MRFQATALMTSDLKKILEDLAAAHGQTQSRVLIAGLLALSGYFPDEQKLWLKAVDAVFANDTLKEC